MRWSAKPELKHGDIVIFKRFAFFPKRINTTWHWLEYYFTKEKLDKGNYADYSWQWSVIDMWVGTEGIKK
jgi:hypothetical protein